MINSVCDRSSFPSAAGTSNLGRYRRMGIKELLRNRQEQPYYGAILGKANKRVFVMGTSCSILLRTS